jgi:hypothetical protein
MNQQQQQQYQQQGAQVQPNAPYLVYRYVEYPSYRLTKEVVEDFLEQLFAPLVGQNMEYYVSVRYADEFVENLGLTACSIRMTTGSFGFLGISQR